MTHTVIPISFWIAFGNKFIPTRLLIIGILFSILPDADVIAFRFGIPYESDWGHRGFSHSILFAFSLSVLACVLVRWLQVRMEIVISFLFVSILSHGFLDAMTNGGLGVGFLIPYSSERFFFNLRPIRVSPIGIKNFLTARGLLVLRSEILIVWFPLLSIAISIFLIRTRTRIE
ncbi:MULTISPECIES: metal-dependent hydrolase [Leptospira]|uniref:Putative membrane-bound metal-dependent hydrolase n=1 Tax=Leptospira weilii str. 2006001853 TaxID=1001589 RepID=A0A828YY63_9LEPT|nr:MULTISPECIES: metal-dependent hydrolase [Leptospira]EKR62440.1 putative membrane-bound metal-dependent hydrolase [Leptospira weilii str. 2006001853]EMJ63259.1 putative membrane-bound metal-dependent hydrolase [Leptospira sp. P2653]EMN42577.1 putative membrane-bound metal-dependent hydrolase [Leptospira weilii str. LNT 1234]QDK24707.1 metal-dependent hydrolase [Leptospira weilii]QDK28659.1 metal-dependent hydrolase [Leptospira weilii]